MEHSAGLILFREKNNKREYLLLYSEYITKYWSFSKGTIEKNEIPEQTAIREANEETNLKNIKFVKGFEEKYSYFKKTTNNKTILKQVDWFLGKVLDENNGKISEEHLDLVWLPYEKAIEKLTYNNDKELLTKAEEYLNKKK